MRFGTSQPIHEPFRFEADRMLLLRDGALWHWTAVRSKVS